LAQLGNRVQHALRAFTPRDQKGIKLMAQTFRPNPKINVEQAITDLEVGEALISFLDEKGSPCVVERAFVYPPQSRIGAITPDERQANIKNSIHYGNYETLQDRESAFEVLKKRTEEKAAAAKAPEVVPVSRTAQRGRPADSLMEAMAKSAARSIGSSVGRQIIRGVLGSILGGGTTRRRRY
jgi:uncharacterized protein